MDQSDIVVSVKTDALPVLGCVCMECGHQFYPEGWKPCPSTSLSHQAARMRASFLLVCVPYKLLCRHGRDFPSDVIDSGVQASCVFIPKASIGRRKLFIACHLEAEGEGAIGGWHLPLALACVFLFSRDGYVSVILCWFAAGSRLTAITAQSPSTSGGTRSSPPTI